MGNGRSLSTSFSQINKSSLCRTHLQIGRTHLNWSVQPIHSFCNEHLRTTRGTKAQEHKTSSSMDTFRAVRQILDYNMQRKFHHHGQLLDSRASEATPFQLPRAIVSFTGVANCADDNWKKKKKKKNEQ